MRNNKIYDLSILNQYQTLVIENDKLKAENKILKAQLDILNSSQEVISETQMPPVTPIVKTEIPCKNLLYIPTELQNIPIVNQKSKPEEKISLFMSLFKGREDVYAKRWQNKKGESGYSPVCLNEWKLGICNKSKIKCIECTNKFFENLNEKVIEEHLMGNIIAGVYPLQFDETCYFLAIDFDEGSWQKDITVLRSVCIEFDIPPAVERSRSGNGAHVWFFFEELISAAVARKFGTALLTYAMNKRHEIRFNSYDRLFPNQDTMPKGGFGNLIALPLQMTARKKGNSIFIDEYFKPYPDQWEFLSSIKKISEDKIESLIAKLSNIVNGSELGTLRRDDEEIQKPWAKIQTAPLIKDDFPEKINIVKANMIYILKSGISQRALNTLKRLAAFKNPEFYKAQAMRMPVFNKPRIISCSDETEEYLCLPRGCEEDIISLLNKFDLDIEKVDKTNYGRKINVEFNGNLRTDQITAVNELIKYKNGVLAAATAFGKTVIAAKLIAERKTSTLVLVHRRQLLSQWIKKLSEFVNIKEELPALENKRGRQKRQFLLGQIGGGKEYVSGIIDVAIMQSLYRENEVKEFVKNYGMVIVDECHHIPAFSFEQILKNVHAKYVYGLTATPVRLDGHHPIIFMHCGPVRFKVDAKQQAEQRPFGHYVIPRFTGFIIPFDKDDANPASGEKQLTIQELYSELTLNEMRNQLIANDVIKNWEDGRSSLVLTERTAHVELLMQKLREKIPDVIKLIGKTGVKENREALNKISETAPGKPLTLVATGKYIGEGFDEPRLDTLFLAMPVSWKGTLQQYVGRLHRLYENKNEVQVYDYVDTHVRMLEKMYNKRLSGYASLGYKTKGELVAVESANFIFNKNSFLPVYNNDIVNAQREIFIISPFVTRRRIEHMLQYLKSAMDNDVKVIIMTRPYEDFNERGGLFLRNNLDILKNEGVNLLFKSNIHQKFAVIDRQIVWYGSINLLSFGSAEESIMRLKSSNIAYELLKIIEE